MDSAKKRIPQRSPRKQISSYEERTFDPFVTPSKPKVQTLRKTGIKDSILAQLDGRVNNDTRPIASYVSRKIGYDESKERYKAGHTALFDRMSSIKSRDVTNKLCAIALHDITSSQASPGKRAILDEIGSPNKRRCLGSLETQKLKTPPRSNLPRYAQVSVETGGRCPTSSRKRRHGEGGSRTLPCRVPRPKR